MEKSEILKNVMPAVIPLINGINETFFKPKLLEIATKLNLNKKRLEHLLSNKFNDYLKISYEKYSIMSTIVFHNQQKLLKELYVPLSIVNADKVKYVIDKFDSQFINKYERILITDTAGMGKSTILKKIFLSIIDESAGIPVLIELRRISKQNDIINEILNQLNTIDTLFDKAFLLEFLKQGNFIFLFDGFDEIPDDDKRFTTKEIQNFVNKASNNRFIITSRPETALKSFGDFNEFKVNPLTTSEAYILLKKYDNYGNVSNQLIKKLKENKNQNFSEFLTNPLLVSLLFAAFEHKQTIPIRKHIFYRQVYDALFESHDLTKGDSFARDKFSKLDIDEFHRVLRHLGFNCMLKGKIEFTKDEIINLIAEAKFYCNGLNFKESDFLKDLMNTVPLFVLDGIYYKWSHKSLQEYFAAYFIFVDSKENQKDILLRIYHHPKIDKYINLIDLYYSIDYKSFSEVIIRELLNDFFSYLKNSYKGFPIKGKKERQILTFNYSYSFCNKEGEELNDNDHIEEIRNSFQKTDYSGWIMQIHREVLKNNEALLVPCQSKRLTDFIDFLHNKKEKFVKKISSIDNLEIEKLDLNSKKYILLDEDKNSILNKKNNFENVNFIIKYYFRNELVFIDETEATKYLKNISLIDSKTTKNSFLNF